ncbi:hypothetical protein GCM10008940_30680 [Microbulbifer agarilyticus]
MLGRSPSVVFDRAPKKKEKLPVTYEVTNQPTPKINNAARTINKPRIISDLGYSASRYKSEYGIPVTGPRKMVTKPQIQR